MQTKETSSDVLEMLDAFSRETSSQGPSVRIGTLVGLTETGRALVRYPGSVLSDRIEARSSVPLSGDRIGRDVLVLTGCGDLRQPVVIGVLQEEGVPSVNTPSVEGQLSTARHVDADGERVVITAEKEIVLRCGEASITLTREGKVLLRGKYVSSRSSGVNRIKGGAVEIN